MWLFSWKKWVQPEPWIYITGNNQTLYHPPLRFWSDSAAFRRRCPSLRTGPFGYRPAGWQNSCWDMCWLLPCCSKLAGGAQPAILAHVWHPVWCSLTANCPKTLLEFERRRSRDTAGKSFLAFTLNKPLLNSQWELGTAPLLISIANNNNNNNKRDLV